MNDQRNQTDPQQNTTTIAIWENEGGAPGRDLTEHQYGRRVEADRSWTVYHVFTGVTARVGDNSMTGLSRLQATSSMMSLNHRNAERRKDRISLAEVAPNASNEAMERRS
jgi:hypothetical protein